MKTLMIVLISIALLIFSGCYTQLLIEDDPQPVRKPQPVFAIPAPVVVDPLMPGMTSDEILVSAPEPVYVPVNSPEPITGYSNPAGWAQQPVTIQRTSGEQRSAPAPSQPASQNNSRSTGATRSGGR
jgi:hypothetical protein